MFDQSLSCAKVVRVFQFSPVYNWDISVRPGIESLSCIVNIVCYSVREYVVIEESKWCPAGIIEHFEKFKMASWAGHHSDSTKTTYSLTE